MDFSIAADAINNACDTLEQSEVPTKLNTS